MRAATTASALYHRRLNDKTPYALKGHPTPQHDFNLLSPLQEVLCRLQ